VQIYYTSVKCANCVPIFYTYHCLTFGKLRFVMTQHGGLVVTACADSMRLDASKAAIVQ